LRLVGVIATITRVEPMGVRPLVLCFGDSLTAGYQTPSSDNPVGREIPYGQFLERLLEGRARIEISGICGETTGEMVLRFRAAVLDRRPRYVVMLGGTNDLGWNASPEEIMRNLVKMYELARAAQIVPIPVTVPSLRAPNGATGEEASRWITEHIARRQRLNHLIADYARSKSLRWVDLFTATADPESLQLRPEYSNDGLHLTTEGYRRFAVLLHDHIFSALLSGGPT
jgi:acyl-CoA thioesterase I